MLRYALGRLLSIVPVLLGVSLIVFLLMHIIPGDTATALLGPMATESQKEALRHALGLDLPLPIQYWNWINGILHGNLGTSLATSIPVGALILPKFVNTAILAAAALALALVLGYASGIAAAAGAFGPIDRATTATTVLLGSTPAYWLALVLVIVFSLQLRWLPATGMYSFTDPDAFGSLARHLVLPAIATALGPAAIIARLTRAAMVEVLGQDYIRVAKAKGIARAVVLRRHALRNALPPMVTISGLQLGDLLGGAVFTEVVFAWPGLGQQLYTSILARDVPVVQAATLLVALVFVLANLLVDLLNAAIDPRIRMA